MTFFYYWLIDWLVFNANFSNISAISWHYYWMWVISDMPEGLSLIFLPWANWKRHELEWWNFVFCWKPCWIIYLKEINKIVKIGMLHESVLNARPSSVNLLRAYSVFGSNVSSSIPNYSSQDLDALRVCLLSITVPLAQYSTNWNKGDIH